MKVHKEDTRVFEPFVDSLISKSNGSYLKKSSAGNRNYSNYSKTSDSEKYPNYFQALYTFEKRVQQFNTENEVVFAFNTAIGKLIDVKDSEIFFFNLDRTRLLPVSNIHNRNTVDFIDKAYGNGLLTSTFENGRITIVQTPKRNTRELKHENHIVIPISESKDYRGALVILTTLPSFKDHVLEFQLINIMLRMVVNKIDTIALEQNLKTTVEELHNYQSKLSNDFKLSAIGELTYGIVEHIYSPLQVILSSAELLKMSLDEEEHSVIENIKEQIEKVKMMINPLVKFAQSSESKPTMEACNLNDNIRNYYNVINPSFKVMNYECILDLENRIPTLLANSNEINQLLTNIFTLIKSEPQSSGGILIQTKHQNNQILFKIASTDYLPVLVDYQNNPTKDLSLMMLTRFMNKNEGKITIETAPQKGTTITLVFPSKRKI